MLSFFDLAAILLSLTAAAAWFNSQFLKLPNPVGLLVIAIAISLLLLGVRFAFPDLPLQADAIEAIKAINFPQTLFNGMLAFLLFAGALHVDISGLRERGWVVFAMATFGVLISAALVGSGIWIIARAFGADIPFASALVFGALISPTDPVAVLATLKNAPLPPALETEIVGESLFNDGVGIVLFTVLLSVAVGGPEGQFSVSRMIELFVFEALGGGIVGLVIGYVAYRAMRRIDEYGIEVLISLATAMACYAVAHRLGTSGPIAVVVAGILLGNRGAEFAMSERTRRYLFGFWDLVDQLLNSILFLLIGFEVLVLRFGAASLPVALAAIPAVLAARLISVALPVLALRSIAEFVPGTIGVLTWAGIRGGISVALALSLPGGIEGRETLIAATYLIVVFTMVVQGLSLASVARRVMRRTGEAGSGDTAA
jgi:Na+:H+ antiporter